MSMNRSYWKLGMIFVLILMGRGGHSNELARCEEENIERLMVPYYWAVYQIREQLKSEKDFFYELWHPSRRVGEVVSMPIDKIQSKLSGKTFFKSILPSSSQDLAESTLNLGFAIINAGLDLGRGVTKFCHEPVTYLNRTHIQLSGQMSLSTSQKRLGDLMQSRLTASSANAESEVVPELMVDVELAFENAKNRYYAQMNLLNEIYPHLMTEEGGDQGKVRELCREFFSKDLGNTSDLMKMQSFQRYIIHEISQTMDKRIRESETAESTFSFNQYFPNSSL
jgi:hypothetical protein